MSCFAPVELDLVRRPLVADAFQESLQAVGMLHGEADRVFQVRSLWHDASPVWICARKCFCRPCPSAEPDRKHRAEASTPRGKRPDSSRFCRNQRERKRHRQIVEIEPVRAVKKFFSVRGCDTVSAEVYPSQDFAGILHVDQRSGCGEEFHEVPWQGRCRDVFALRHLGNRPLSFNRHDGNVLDTERSIGELEFDGFVAAVPHERPEEIEVHSDLESIHAISLYPEFDFFVRAMRPEEQRIVV